ncbi:MAG: AAC(3) family N-acetyltransferase [Deltaproteobacteria bacterium]|nr:AAC(3) family N-acetyltransferase [Deltaproteobacteria bacterium]
MIGPTQRLKRAVKPFLVQVVWGYDSAGLVKALRSLGLEPGDAVMIHCGFEPSHGFKGTPQELVEAFLSAVGPDGTVAMMSMPYNGMSSYEFLSKGNIFDVRRSISMMGILTEIFRRRREVLRGLHPTHSVAAWGRRAEWLISGQGEDLSPFGEGSPFARLVEADGKILLYDVPFTTMTFDHYLEHCIRDHLPVPLYRSEPMKGVVLDRQGNRREVRTWVLSEEVTGSRRSGILENELLRSRAMRKGRIGRSTLMLGQARAMVAAVQQMVREGRGFHQT